MLSEIFQQQNSIFQIKGEKNIKISNNNYEALARVLSMKQNKKMTIDLLKDITKLNITSFYLKELKTMKNVEEYDFSVVKLEAHTKDNKKQDIYIKLVKRDKIKESIFCYWCLLYEEKFKNKQESEFTNIMNKVRIVETESTESKHTVSLSVKENNCGISECGSDIHLIKFRKYLENETLNPNILRWKTYIADENTDVLLVGVVK